MEARWHRLWSVFHLLRETPVEQRDEDLVRLCAADPAMRDEVRELLRADAAGMNPLDVLPSVARSLPSAPSLGDIVGRYKLVSIIGQGGMGVVYAAEQEEPVRRRAAVKILRSDFSGPREQARFEAEQQALALLSHPNIAQVYDGGTANGHLFMAMEYVEGSAFTSACDERKLDLRARVRMFIQVCEAIQHAHQRGIIHRDLKPSNVLVSGDGDRSIPKVIDFGIAKGIGVRLSSESVQTRVGTLLGTPEYMSPEQAERGDIDTRSDVYALGTMFYELVCGALPFDFGDGDLLQALSTISRQEPKAPSVRFTFLPKEQRDRIAQARATTAEELVRSLRGEIDWMAMKAIEKEPAARYVSAGEFAADLGRFLADQPVLVGPPSGAYRLKKYIRRHRAGAAAVAGVAAALVLGVIGTTWMAAVASRERNAAEIARDDARKEADVARATVDFVQKMLAAPDPMADRSGPGIREVKVVEVLGRAAGDLDGALARQPEVAASLRHTLGKTYFGLGLFDAAKPLLERAAADRTKFLGAEHPDTLTAQHDLAVTYGRLGETQRAGRMIRNTYLTRRRVLGADHPDTIASLDDLGVHYVRIGEFKIAEQHFREALDGFRRVVGPDDRRTLTAMNNLAHALRNHGQREQAEKISRDVLTARKRVLGKDHPETLAATMNLATMVSVRGGTEEAMALTRDAIAGFTAVLGPEHTRTLTARNNLATMLVKSNRTAEAERELADVLAIYERTLGKEHEMTLTIRNNQARAILNAGRKSEALKLYRDFMPVAERVFSRKHGDLATFKLIYSVALAVNGQKAEAGQVVTEAHKQLLETFGPKDHRTILAEDRLNELRKTGTMTLIR